MPRPEKLRLFIAAKIPAAVEHTIEEAIRRYAQSGADVKWVKPQNLHFTLKFLGAVEKERMGGIIESLKAITFPEFSLTIGRPALFPQKSRSPRLVIADAVEGGAELGKLAIFVEKASILAGFNAETRPFMPHLTLGRLKSQKRLKQLFEKIDGAKNEIFGKLSVRAIYLIKSVTKPDGPEYTEMAEVPLEKKGGRDGGNE